MAEPPAPTTTEPAPIREPPVFQYNVSKPIDFSTPLDTSVLKDKTAIITGG
jgi:hypothetical protein